MDVDLYCGLQGPSDTSGAFNLPNYIASSGYGAGTVDAVDFIPVGSEPLVPTSNARASFTPGVSSQLWCSVRGYSSGSMLSFSLRVSMIALQAIAPSSTPVPVETLVAPLGAALIESALTTGQYSYFWAAVPPTGLRVTVATTVSSTAVTLECGPRAPPSLGGFVGLESGVLATVYASNVPSAMDLLPPDALPDLSATGTAVSTVYLDDMPTNGSPYTIWCAVRAVTGDYIRGAARYTIKAQLLNSTSASAASAVAPPCTRAADIVWVVDGSGSIGSSNFDLVRWLINDFALLFPISAQPPQQQASPDAQGVRMAAVEFASQSDGLATIALAGNGSAASSGAFIRAVQALPYFGGSTDTAFGMSGGMLQLRRFPRAPDSGAARIMIVLTDGFSDSQTATLAAAADVRSLGVAIAVITVGSSINWAEVYGMAGAAGTAGGDASYVFALADWTRLRSGVGGNAGFLANFSRVVCEAPALLPAGPATVRPRIACSNATVGMPGGSPARFEIDTSAGVALSGQLAGGGTLTLCYALAISPPSWLAVSAALAAAPTATSPIPGVTCARAAADASTRLAAVTMTVLQRPAPAAGTFLQTAAFATAGLPAAGGFNASCGGAGQVTAAYCAVLIVSSPTSLNPSGMRWFGNPLAGLCSACPPGTTAGPSANTGSPSVTAPFSCVDTGSRYAADVGAGSTPVFPSAAPTASSTPPPLGASITPTGTNTRAPMGSPSRTATRSRSRGSSPADVNGGGEWWLSPSPSPDPNFAFGFAATSGGGGMAPGAIVGIVFGLAVVGIMIAVAVLCACRGNPACPCSPAAAWQRAGVPTSAKGAAGSQAVQIQMQMHSPQLQQQPVGPYGAYFGAPGGQGGTAAGPPPTPGGGAVFMYSHPLATAGGPDGANSNLRRGAHFNMARSSLLGGPLSPAAATGNAKRYEAAPTASGGYAASGGGDAVGDPVPYAYPLAQPYLQGQSPPPSAPGYAYPYPGAYSPATAANANAGVGYPPPGYGYAYGAPLAAAPAAADVPQGGFRPLAALPPSSVPSGSNSSRGLRTASNGGGLRSPSGGLRTASSNLRTASGSLRTASTSTSNALRIASASRGVTFADGQGAVAAAAAGASADDPSRLAGAVSRSNSRRGASFSAGYPAAGAAGDLSRGSMDAGDPSVGPYGIAGQSNSSARRIANMKLLGTYGAAAAALARPAGRARPSVRPRLTAAALPTSSEDGGAPPAAAVPASAGGGDEEEEEEPAPPQADHRSSGEDVDDDDDDDDGEPEGNSGSGAHALSALRLPLDPSMAAYLGCDAASGTLTNPAAFGAYWLFLTGASPDYAGAYACLARLMHEDDAVREGLTAAVERGSFNGGAAYMHSFAASPAAAAVLSEINAVPSAAAAAAAGGSAAYASASAAAAPVAAAGAGGGSARAARRSRKTLSRAQQALLLAEPPPPAKLVLPATVKHKTAVVVKERIVLRRAGMGGAAGAPVSSSGGAGAAGLGGVGVSSRGVVAFEGVKERRLVETETARTPRQPRKGP